MATTTAWKVRIWISVDEALHKKLEASRRSNERTMTWEIISILKKGLK